jgi:UDP-N-acetylglucosamine 2-epimerase (non-hydrolysing)
LVRSQRPIAIVLGTRPEIIKLSPVIRQFQAKNFPFFLIHSNQHYSYEMDRVFFKDLSLPEPDYNLDVGSGGHAEQTAKILVGVECALIQNTPSALVVQGDTNTVFASALAAIKIHVPVCHVEAGLRSGDRSMPEEINRILTDHCSELLFAPTIRAEGNLLNEGIPKAKILVTGNTVVDAIKTNITLASRSKILEKLGISKKTYFLVTLHRAENVDDIAKLSSIILAIQKLGDKFSVDIVLPIHPRTRKNVETNGISLRGLNVIDPIGYLDFLFLEKNASLIMTDSGGVQEEACVLGVPCLTLRDSTERPETVECGSNVLVGADPLKIVRFATTMLEKKNGWENPFGDGKSAERIVASLSGSYGLKRELVLSH